MKPISSSELQILTDDAHALHGGQLQEVLTSDRDVELEIYAAGHLQWIWIDLLATQPFFIRLSTEDAKPALKKKSTPLGLFLKAHGRGRRISLLQKESGRVVLIHFGDPRKPDELLRLEIRLFPHGQNILVESGAKRMAWQKPKELTLAPGVDSSPGSARTRVELLQQWKESRTPTARGHSIATKSPAKLEGIREKLAQQLAEWANPWRELGEWLKENQSLNIPARWEKIRDAKAETLAQHVQSAFQQAKKQDQKREGLEKRIGQLKIEIENIAAAMTSGPKSFTSKSPAAKKDSLFHQSESRGRRAQLTEHLDLYVGKSAVDNLSLLRQAQSWDFWMHIRDVPGCHAILRRPRGMEVSDEILRQAARKVVEFSPRASRELKAGDQFDVVVCEARFIKPIKGDRLGQVTYKNDRTLRVRIE